MTTLKDKIDKTRIPSHIAVIMDGNGRWAEKSGNRRLFGHKNAIIAVRETIEAAAETGVKYLTLYAFSKENWSRPKSEVKGLMSLLVSTMNTELKTLIKNNIRLSVIGDFDSLPPKVREGLSHAIRSTANNKGLNLVVALSYGARWEIIEAVKKTIQDIKKQLIHPADITEQTFAANLNTAGIPDPEILIRTGGEQRISNFLLWQISYAELYFTDILWPDFRKNDFFNAIINFQGRERRFGKTGKQARKLTK